MPEKVAIRNFKILNKYLLLKSRLSLFGVKRFKKERERDNEFAFENRAKKITEIRPFASDKSVSSLSDQSYFPIYHVPVCFINIHSFLDYFYIVLRDRIEWYHQLTEK